jgi:hypothetical protein
VLCLRQECQHPRYRQKRNKEMTKGEEETTAMSQLISINGISVDLLGCQVEIRMYLFHVDVSSVTNGVRAIRNPLGQLRFATAVRSGTIPFWPCRHRSLGLGTLT